MLGSFDLSTAILLAFGLFGAAFVRGLTGFGFSALVISWAALFTNPLPLIPAIFMCEILMTAFQAPTIRQDVQWPLVGALILGAALAIVPSVYLLSQLESEVIRFVVPLLILALACLLLSGWALERRLGPLGNILVGISSGIANAAGVGGLPVAGALSAQPIPARAFRANMIVYLTALDLMTLPVMAANGLVKSTTFLIAALAFPLLGAGVWLGSHAFRVTAPERFRKYVLFLLALLASLGILRALLQLASFK